LTASGNSTINNTVNLNGDVFASVPSGVTAVWSGIINGNSALTKTNTGTLVINGNTNTHTGAVTVNAGTLAVNGNLPASANAVTVNNGGTLAGSGTISRTVSVASGGALAPGNSPGKLTIDGNLTLAAGSSFTVELNGTSLGSSYDNVTINGTARTVTLTNAVLTATTTSNTLLSTDKLFVMILSDAASSFGGTTFAGIAQNGTVFINPIGGAQYYSAQVSYTGDFGTGAIIGGNDLVLYNFAAVPEPATIALMGVIGVGAGGGWYYRRRRILQRTGRKYKKAR
jgi:autotransporter-associated beta strand protein